ncbi:MAG: GlcG/HbpS family heme-binding protein, partial [Acidimicrobiia bacterium]
MGKLSLDQASAIAGRTIEEGRKRDLSPLTVAVVDSGGHLQALQRDDGSEFFRVDIAMGKAWACVGMGVPGRLLGQRASNAPHFFSALAVSSGGRFAPGPGGVLVRDSD